MNNLTRTSNAIAIGEQYGFDRAKVQLIKDLVAKDTNDDELALFLYTAQRTGLDPLARQIYCIMRKDRGVAKMTIQTGIDGYRLIADRTGNYAPGRATTYEYTEDGKVLSATSYVMKYAKNVWHEVSATAFWDEYVAQYNGQVQGLWASKPRIMLGKCAEALALRRAFPAELSGLYTDTEMDQADITVQQPARIVDVTPHEPDPAVLEAEAAFWQRYGKVLGYTQWSAVQEITAQRRVRRSPSKVGSGRLQRSTAHSSKSYRRHR